MEDFAISLDTVWMLLAALSLGAVLTLKKRIEV